MNVQNRLLFFFNTMIPFLQFLSLSLSLSSFKRERGDETHSFSPLSSLSLTFLVSFSSPSLEQVDDSHDDAGGSHVRTETLADSRHFPENASESRLAAVQKRRIQRMNVRTRAHKKQKHNQNALKFEKCRHG